MPAEAVQFPAVDGYTLHGTLFLPSASRSSDIAVVLNSATGVQRRFYGRVATYLAEQHGLAVLTYDYRGIADSRPRNLRSSTRGSGTGRSWICLPPSIGYAPAFDRSALSSSAIAPEVTSWV